jgi:hypothetical protein
MVGQFPLFDTHTLNGQTTVEDAIDATHAEQREQIARAAAEVEQEPTSGAEEVEQGHTEGAHTAALVAFVRGYALARSEDGRDAWDVLIETYTRAQIAELLGDATNETDAVARAAARVAQIMAQYNAEEPEAPVISGPWGVFESDLCIAAVDAKATADMLAAEAVAADDGASEVVVRALCAEHIDAEQPRDTCEECAADGAEDDDQDAEPGVDVESLGMSPMVRALVADIDAGPWHYQTRKGAHVKGLTTDIKATALTAFGERVRAALLAE